MPMPALFTRKLKSSRSHFACRTCFSLSAKPSKDLLSEKSSASAAALLHNLFGFSRLAFIGQDDVISFRGDVQRHALAQTAASASYECDFHGCPLLKWVIPCLQ